MTYINSAMPSIANGEEILNMFLGSVEDMAEANIVEVVEPLLCAYSGEVIEGEPFEVEGRLYADQRNARLDGCWECANCGDWHYGATYLIVDGDYYCDEDCAREAGYEQCARCGAWFRSEYGIEIGEQFFCDRVCARRAGYSQCEHCGEWASNDETYTVRYGGCNETWCEGCMDWSARECECCGDLVHEDDGWTGDDGYWLCEDCHDRHRRHLHEYGYCPPIQFFGGNPWTPKSGLLFMGVELETDKGCDAHGYAEALDCLPGFDEHFWMTEDGSLDNGVEITSHPMTLAYHWSKMALYEGIGRVAHDYGFTSHDAVTCGLHVSVNKSFFGESADVIYLGVYKMMRLYQRFERQVTAFSRRGQSELNRWATFRTYHDYEPKPVKVNVHNADGTEGEQSTIAKARTFMNHDRDKYRAVNICHRNHVEIRVFRGTLKWSTYFATLAFVEGVARVAKAKDPMWVETVTWYDFIAEVVDAVSVEGPREMLREYLESKGLLS